MGSESPAGSAEYVLSQHEFDGSQSYPPMEAHSLLPMRVHPAWESRLKPYPYYLLGCRPRIGRHRAAPMSWPVLMSDQKPM